MAEVLGRIVSPGGDIGVGPDDQNMVSGIGGIPISTTPPTDGQVLTYVAADSDWEPANPILPPTQIISGVPGLPGNGAIVLIYTAPTTITLPSDLVGSVGSVGVNPTSTAVYTLLLNGSSVGTVSVSTSGVFTFSTSSLPISMVSGDRLTMTAPSPQDATLSDVGMTLISQ